MKAIKELGIFYNKHSLMIHPMKKDGTPDMNKNMAVHLHDLDMDQRAELETILERDKPHDN